MWAENWIMSLQVTYLVCEKLEIYFINTTHLKIPFHMLKIYIPTYWLFYFYNPKNITFKIWYWVIIAFEKNDVRKQQRFSCLNFRYSGVVNINWISLTFTQRIRLNKQIGRWSLHGWERKVKCRLSFVFWYKKCRLYEVWQKIRYSTLETYEWNLSVTVLPEPLGTTFLPDPHSREWVSHSLSWNFFSHAFIFVSVLFCFFLVFFCTISIQILKHKIEG